VLRVVDGGIAMVVGSTVGVVLVPGGDYGGRCEGQRNRVQAREVQIRLPAGGLV